MNPAAPQYPVVSINSNCGSVTDSYKNVWKNCDISLSDEKRQVLKWLSPLASRERHHAVRDARADRVGDWLLHTPSKFSTWRALEDWAAKTVLLRYGDPGVGKTYISSLVIDALSSGIDGDSMTTTYVYCDYSARNAQPASTISGSALRQVVGALTQIPGEVHKAFICIDALDEFPTKHRARLWDSVQRIVRECPNTRLFITTRRQIRTEVENYFTEDADMVTIKPTLCDIGTYIEKRLRDPDLYAMDKKLRADIVRIIPEMISEIFLLVCIAMYAILAETTIHQRRQALHRMTNRLSLQDTCNATLDRVRLQGEGKTMLGMEALMWISHYERPSEPELCHALEVESGAEDFNIHNMPPIQA